MSLWRTIDGGEISRRKDGWMNRLTDERRRDGVYRDILFFQRRSYASHETHYRVLGCCVDGSEREGVDTCVTRGAEDGSSDPTFADVE